MIREDSIREIQTNGFCVLKSHFPECQIHPCREAFWPKLLAHLGTHGDHPNRGPHRHFLPVPFKRPCFAPQFFFDPDILAIVRGLMGDRIVADQWGCDVSLRGSDYQEVHVDFRRPLFEELPDLPLPPYALVVSFGLVPIGPEHGPIEIAPGTHRLPGALKTAQIGMQAVPLEIGDVLIRHPWALHRGTPNTTETPRALASIRYVRRWYTDDSREVASIGSDTWHSLTPDQQALLRFPLEIY